MRFLLHDTGRALNTDSRFFSDSTLMRALNFAVVEMANEIIAPDNGSPITVRGMVMVSRLQKQMAAPDGTAIPSDFWFLVCGYKSDNSYVPAVDVMEGEKFSYLSTTPTRVYVKQGVFNGPQDSVLYWSVPPLIANDATTLTMFPDAFYNAAKIRACRDAVMQEDKDAVDRWTFLHEEYMKCEATLK